MDDILIIVQGAVKINKMDVSLPEDILQQQFLLESHTVLQHQIPSPCLEKCETMLDACCQAVSLDVHDLIL